jgi:hypothetical protein
MARKNCLYFGLMNPALAADRKIKFHSCDGRGVPSIEESNLRAKFINSQLCGPSGK